MQVALTCRMSSIFMYEGAIHIHRELNRVYIIH